MHSPEHITLADQACEALDMAAVAAKSNALTGGCLREEDAGKVAKLVILAALQTPGTVVTVAAMTAVQEGNQLRVGLYEDLLTIES